MRPYDCDGARRLCDHVRRRAAEIAAQRRLPARAKQEMIDLIVAGVLDERGTGVAAFEHMVGDPCRIDRDQLDDGSRRTLRPGLAATSEARV